MTAGQDALREAARLESARVYGKTLAQHRGEQAPGHVPALLADEFDLIVDARRAVATARNVVPLASRRRAAS